MLTREENEAITRVGPGTPMGALMRQYWLPALLSVELPAPDGDPVRVKLLGEELIAFRDSDGRIGLLANACPHRGASLFFARNEDCGLRCVYHGWKFDAEGRCLDMPNEPPESTFKERVRARAYPTRERGGIVWAYMGPRAEPPPLPSIEANMLPEDEVVVWAALRECNWVQAMDGDLDSSHVGFLHLGNRTIDETEPGTFSHYVMRDRAPRYAIVDTEYGCMYGAYRPAEADSYYWRVAHFLFPFYTEPAVGVLGLEINARAWVPMDDEHTMFFFMLLKSSFQRAASAGRPESTALTPQQVMDFEPNGTGWYDRWRLAANARNDYVIDRAKQRGLESYTGIAGIHLQDQAITEMMGPIVDRTGEHLASADAMMIRTRRRLLDAAYALRDRGAVPPGVDDPDVYLQRPGGVILPRAADWQEATEGLRRAFAAHPELSRAITGSLPAV